MIRHQDIMEEYDGPLWPDGEPKDLVLYKRIRKSMELYYSNKEYWKIRVYGQWI